MSKRLKDVDCPYCGEWQEICHDDGFGYEEGVKHEMQCEDCEMNFVFTTNISFYYDSEKADCLNEDGKHDWKPIITAPKRYTDMICTVCDARRKPTIIEKTKYEIPD